MRYPIVIVIVVWVFTFWVSSAWARPVNLLSVIGSINRECVKLQHFPNTCANGLLDIISYFAPTYAVAVTNKTGKPVLLGIPGLTEILAGVSGGATPTIAGGGALDGSPDAAKVTNKHFLEARVYTLPSILTGVTCGVCDGPSGLLPQVNYVSDLDVQWRTRLGFAIPGLTELGIPGLSIGRWGPKLPRSGMAIHSSQVVAAALAATRALDIANHPAEALPTPTVRPVILPNPEPSSCFQVAHPIPSICLPPGANPLHFETLRLEEEAQYVFIFWTLKTCCVDPATALACRAISGGGTLNFCLNGMEPLTGIVPGAPLGF